MIFGIVCSLINPLFSSLQAVFAKMRLKEIGALEDAVIFARFFYVVPILIVYALLRGTPLPVIDPWFLPTMVLLIGLEVPSQYFYHRAITKEKISLVRPIESLIGIPMMTSFIFFQGWSWIGCAGILIITGGVYILQARTHGYTGGNMFEPIKSMWRHKESRLMLYAVLLWSITTPLQRVAVHMSNLEIMGICYLSGSSVLVVVKAIKKGIPTRSIVIPKKVYLFAPVGLLAGFAAIMQYTAVALINPAYVLAFKQTRQFWAILFDRVFFHEKITSSQGFSISIIIIGSLIVGVGVL